MKKITSLILALVLTFSLVALSACGDKTTDDKKAAASDDKVITVGASATPHAEILEQIKQALADEGYELKIVTYDDYVLPNQALADGTLDANYFQHKPYMDDFNKQKGTKLVAMAFIHYEPFGIYGGRCKDLNKLKDGAIVSVPNDTTNEARALLLLNDRGLITLKNKSLTATRLDISSNPKNLKIEEIEAPQLVRSLPDVDISIINGNFAMLGGLKEKDALAAEKNDSLAAATFANIIAVRAGDENRPDLKALCEVLKSDQIKKFMQDKYQGGVVPAK